MSTESDQPEPDAVDEALARAEFPVRYGGEVLERVNVEVSD